MRGLDAMREPSLEYASTLPAPGYTATRVIDPSSARQIVGCPPQTTVYGTQVYNQHGGSVFISTFTAGEKSVETKAAATVMPTWRFAGRVAPPAARADLAAQLL